MSSTRGTVGTIFAGFGARVMPDRVRLVYYWPNRGGWPGLLGGL